VLAHILQPPSVIGTSTTFLMGQQWEEFGVPLPLSFNPSFISRSTLHNFFNIGPIRNSQYIQHFGNTVADNYISIIFFSVSFLSAILSFSAITFPYSPITLQDFISRHSVLFVNIHAILLTVSSVSSALCSCFAAHLTNLIGASTDVPLKIDNVVFWYYHGGHVKCSSDFSRSLPSLSLLFSTSGLSTEKMQMSLFCSRKKRRNSSENLVHFRFRSSVNCTF
ncbi:hypothetical protein PMAYCL1PPCAC_32966, partial [Pristionchus mayeri]